MKITRYFPHASQGLLEHTEGSVIKFSEVYDKILTLEIENDNLKDENEDLKQVIRKLKENAVNSLLLIEKRI